MRNVVLASNEASKGKRFPLNDNSPENPPSKKTAAMNKSNSPGRTPAPKKLSEKKAQAKSSKEKKLIPSMLIKVSKGKFIEVLGKLRKEVSPDASGATLVSARATQNGDVLILLDRSSNKEGFTAKVQRVVEVK